MTPKELVEAANHTMTLRGCVSNKAIACAEHTLSTVHADDDEPVNEEWIKSLLLNENVAVRVYDATGDNQVAYQVSTVNDQRFSCLRNICRGPFRSLCRGLGVSGAVDGVDLSKHPVKTTACYQCGTRVPYREVLKSEQHLGLRFCSDHCVGQWEGEHAQYQASRKAQLWPTFLPTTTYGASQSTTATSYAPSTTATA